MRHHRSPRALPRVVLAFCCCGSLLASAGGGDPALSVDDEIWSVLNHTREVASGALLSAPFVVGATAAAAASAAAPRAEEDRLSLPVCRVTCDAIARESAIVPPLRSWRKRLLTELDRPFQSLL